MDIFGYSQEEMSGYIHAFEAAFDELIQVVMQSIQKSGIYIAPHHDYPQMFISENGFPSFHEAGFSRRDTPRDYVGVVSEPKGLLEFYESHTRSASVFPKSAALLQFLKDHEVGRKLNIHGSLNGDYIVHRLVGDAVERYLHLYGLQEPITQKRRKSVILPILSGTVIQRYRVRLVVPITLTQFKVDRFPLAENAYVTRLPKKLQLARARMSTLGSGADKSVVGAATHAFVSKNWELKVENIDQVPRYLERRSADALDEIDSFFGSLRVATGISTGYAQILWVPDKWALDYYCDLTPVYGATLRQYPSEYDDYGWTRPGATVSVDDLGKVRSMYRAVIESESEAVRLALRRLNGCLTRTDAADAILDATIGLELLLGDSDKDSVSYKLRMRAGALAALCNDPSHSTTDIAAKVKKLYAARSNIVHGRRRKRSKDPAESSDVSHAEERQLSEDLLRVILNVVLTNPQYQDNPGRIDEDLILRRIDAG